MFWARLETVKIYGIHCRRRNLVDSRGLRPVSDVRYVEILALGFLQIPETLVALRDAGHLDMLGQTNPN